MHWKELEVWKLSHEMVLDVYRRTRSFPDHEKFRLTSQLCRAASSVPANIVEGNARYSRKEYIQFLVTARASLEETRYHSLLARDLHYLGSLDHDQFEAQAERISRMLNSFIDPSEPKEVVMEKGNPNMGMLRIHSYPFTPLPHCLILYSTPITPLPPLDPWPCPAPLPRYPFTPKDSRCESS